ncbi:MAG: RHS repeat-associated core domain-containing protein [Myxococcota bacterium]
MAGRFEFTRHWHGNTLVLFDSAGGRKTVRHDAEGSVFVDHGNGTHEAQRFDADGRVLGRACSRRNGGGDFEIFWNVSHRYTAEGDLRETDDSIRGQRRYSMDAAHRLVQVTSSVGSAQYKYDSASNLTEMPSVGSVAMDTGNRLRTAGAERFTYDGRQRLSSRVGMADSEVRYFYDDEDQLIRVEDGGEAWTATYDGLGRRVTFGRGDKKTRLWWDGDRVAAREAPDGAFRIFQYVDRESLVPLGFVDYDSIEAQAESGRSYTVFSDQVGLPQHIENAKGEIVWWGDHATPYGELFVRPGNEIAYHMRFPGHIYDPDLALHYNRFRDYDPQLGRYLQPDPLGTKGGTNLYAYTSNPVVSVDVLGLAPGHNNGENGSSRGEDGEGRPNNEDPDGADAPPPPRRVTPEEAEAIARREAAAYQREVADAAAAGTLEGFEGQKPPACVAVVVDHSTGTPYRRHNEPSGPDAPAMNPNDYHPAIRQRVIDQQNPQDGQTGHPSQPASHAEVLALNDALWARDPDGTNLTSDDLGDFTQLPVWAREPQERPHMPPGGAAPCCGNCAPITRGTNNLSGDAPAWVWRDGRWVHPRDA